MMCKTQLSRVERNVTVKRNILISYIHECNSEPDRLNDSVCVCVCVKFFQHLKIINESFQRVKSRIKILILYI